MLIIQYEWKYFGVPMVMEKPGALMEFWKSQVVLLCKEMNCHSDISSITLHASACVSVAVEPNMFARQRFVFTITYVYFLPIGSSAS